MAKKLTPAQMKIAKLAKPFDKITKEDFAVLRSKRGTKVKGEAKKPMQFGDKKIKIKSRLIKFADLIKILLIQLSCLLKI